MEALSGQAERTAATEAAVLVEACVDTVASAVAAERGGARRLELCDDLVEGGTTPSAGMIATVRERVSVPVFVIVRPRGGDFLYDADDVAVMLRDVEAARGNGADGVVIGALTAEGRVDAELTRRLVDAARPLAVTFHRAFDVVRDQHEALDTLLAFGVDRVLTSGGAPTALEGMPRIRRLVAHAGGGIALLAGGRVDASNAARIVAETGVRELHVRGTERVTSAMRYRRAEIVFGKRYEPDEYVRSVTSAQLVAEIVRVAAEGAKDAARGDSSARSESSERR